MRLIDADALADALFDKHKNYPQWVADVIGNMPEAVVLCRNCRYGEKSPTFQYYPNLTWCNKHSTSHNDDWFCAGAERRDE